MRSYACMFPGQGSQSVGMLSEWAAVNPIVQATFEEASSVLGYDAWALAQQGPLTVLNQTEKTQPLVLAAGVAMWRIWSTQMPTPPVALVGHSLGEYTALVCAGSLPFVDAVRMVAHRGACMQNAVPADVGAMAAILGLEVAQVDAICAKVAEGAVVASANYNAPDQIVIAGEKQAVLRATQEAKSAGGRAVLLPVSVPSHCMLMRPAAVKMEAYFAQHATFSPATMPVYHNVDVSLATPSGMGAALVAQLYRPVRWVDTMAYLLSQGVEGFVECGPGSVLTGLSKRIHPTGVPLALGTPAGMEKAITWIQNIENLVG